MSGSRPKTPPENSGPRPARCGGSRRARGSCRLATSASLGTAGRYRHGCYPESVTTKTIKTELPSDLQVSRGESEIKLKTRAGRCRVLLEVPADEHAHVVLRPGVPALSFHEALLSD